MKKIFILILIILLIILTACNKETDTSGNNEKMKGFTYEELAEYFLNIDGLVAYEPGTVIQCGEYELELSTFKKNLSAYDEYSAIELNKLFVLTIPVDDPDSDFYAPLLDGNKWGGPMEDIIRTSHSFYYISGRAPNNFAYLLRDSGFKSSPEWTDWIEYNIPIRQQTLFSHGNSNRKWYNPITAEFEVGIYCRTFEDSTEVYVVYQEISLFYDGMVNRHTPYLMSEDMYNYLQSTYDDFHSDAYKKGTVKEFSDWFMGEYVKKIPPVFSDIKDKYVYYPVYGNGFSFGGVYENYDAVKMFIPDLEQLGVNFDEIRSYIIKATVPHDGTIQDIFWELIG